MSLPSKGSSNANWRGLKKLFCGKFSNINKLKAQCDFYSNTLEKQKQKLQTERSSTWLLMQAFDLDVRHKPGFIFYVRFTLKDNTINQGMSLTNLLMEFLMRNLFFFSLVFYTCLMRVCASNTNTQSVSWVVLFLCSFTLRLQWALVE